MVGLHLALFLAAAFVGGVTTGLAGFAFGLLVSGVWLHIITPQQSATLIIGYGLVVQSYGIWKLRHALSWRAIAPFVGGGLFGVPIGAWLLAFANPAGLRLAVGVFLVLYSTYGLTQPALRPVPRRTPLEVGVGFINGLIVGMSGFGVLAAIWCNLRNLSKDAQRAFYQPVIFAVSVITAASLTVGGAVTADVVRLYLLGLPVVLAGAWVGIKLYGRLDDKAFRKVVLVLLIVSGISLVVPELVRLAA